jgi:DNA topoisomerase VI subunit B
MSAPVLKRSTFRTSRLLEFCSQKELVLQTGHPVEEWALVILKELVDNALDACEEAGIAPEITVAVGEGLILVHDNGPGMPAKTVKDLLDYTVRVSSHEAYASPTRGAQGNALKTLIAMPFALDGTKGESLIEARGVSHQITFTVDHVRQVPQVDHVRAESDVKNGTRVAVRCPNRASANADTKSRFLQIAEDYTWLNPHLTLHINWDGERRTIAASDPKWTKWKPSNPTSAHWYDVARLERLIAAYAADDLDRKRSRTVREFVSEFRDLSATAKQKVVLDATGMARTALPDLFRDGEVDRTRIGKLLAAMQANSKPVKPAALGLIGKDHLAARFEAAGVDPKTFQYKRTLCNDDGIPAVIEIAFGYCPEGPLVRRIVTGVNWSVGINNPFRNLGQYGESLDTFLSQQRVGRNEPIVLLVHLASPRIAYTDRGKSALALRGEIEAPEPDEDEELDE